MLSMSRSCAVIPAFNEESTIGRVVGAAREQVPDVVVVDDGSTDGTAREAARAGAVVLSHRANRGKGAALRTGFRHALDRRLDPVVTLDGDGQHDAGEIGRLVEALRDADLVIGSRPRSGRVMPKMRRLTNASSSALVSLLAGHRLHDVHSGFRAVRARVLRSLEIRSNRYEAEIEWILKTLRAGFRVREVPVRTIYDGQTSGIRPWRDAFRFFRVVGWSAGGLEHWADELRSLAGGGCGVGRRSRGAPEDGRGADRSPRHP
jgi:glycosyltransferase involved in cell wall biosynthesis